mmetsp:Transcript_2015/g.5807  ORF Transcript_2015/g.5807 Transcript_2015/m.5807 type:complete len:522 (+) Transcript_2015:96-1661(+)
MAVPTAACCSWLLLSINAAYWILLSLDVAPFHGLPAAHAFVSRSTNTYYARPSSSFDTKHLPLFGSSSRSSRSNDNTDDDEDDLERRERERMAAVRALQKTFYQSSAADSSSDDDGGLPDTTTLAPPQLQPSTGILTNLGLWRVGWVETPGRANCLNVHEGQYTHLFETVLSQPKPWYVGHLHLPGGFKMARTEEERYDLKTWRDELDDDLRFQQKERSAVVGTVMRISDYRRMEDGRLIILVHPQERFVVDRIVQHFPYSVADVQILPDAEELLLPLPQSATNKRSLLDDNFCKIARAAAVQRAFGYHEYEYDSTIKLPLSEDVEYLPAEGIPQEAIAKILPFAFYSKDDSSLQVEDEPSEEINNEKEEEEPLSFAGGSPPLEQLLKNGGILQDPPFVPGPETINRRTTDVNTLETLLWLALDDFCQSTRFVLPEEILCLMPPELDYLEMAGPAQPLSDKYPSHRRQQRLSYLAPALLEGVEIGAGLRQMYLNAPSTQVRLAAVLERYELVNSNIISQFQ